MPRSRREAARIGHRDPGGRLTPCLATAPGGAWPAAPRPKERVRVMWPGKASTDLSGIWKPVFCSGGGAQTPATAALKSLRRPQSRSGTHGGSVEHRHGWTGVGPRDLRDRRDRLLVKPKAHCAAAELGQELPPAAADTSADAPKTHLRILETPPRADDCTAGRFSASCCPEEPAGGA